MPSGSGYQVAYWLFYDEVLAATTQNPFEMQSRYQERYAFDPHLRDCYRNRYAHHGFHPFTVWYWATYPLKYRVVALKGVLSGDH